MTAFLIACLVLGNPTPQHGKGEDMRRAWDAKLSKAKNLKGRYTIIRIQGGLIHQSETKFVYQLPNKMFYAIQVGRVYTSGVVSDGKETREFDPTKGVVKPAGIPRFPPLPMIEKFTGYGLRGGYDFIRAPKKPTRWQGRDVYEVVMRQRGVHPAAAPIHHFYFDAKTGAPVGDHKFYPGRQLEIIIRFKSLVADGIIPPNQFELFPIGNTTRVESWLNRLKIGP